MTSSSPFRLFWHRVLTWSGPLLLLFFAAHKAVEWQTERLWFEGVGYRGQFDHLLLWRLGAFSFGAGFMALWLGLNAQLAWRNAALSAVPLAFFETQSSARLIPIEDKLQLDRYRRRATVTVVALLSWLMGLGFAARYTFFLRAFYSQKIGQIDPASNFDLSFFFFELPLWQWMSRFCMVALVAALLLVVAIYLYEETIGFTERSPRWSGSAAKHLATLWVALLLWKAADSLLSVPLSFVNSGNVATRVFDPIDMRFGWTSSAVLALMAPFLALLSGFAIAKKPRYQTFLYGIFWMISTRAVPFLLTLLITGSPQDVEWKDAIARHLRDTRTAWGLGDVTSAPLEIEPDASFTALNLPASATELPLPLWPPSSAREAMNNRLDASDAPLEVERVHLERENGSLFYVGVGAPTGPEVASSWRQRHFRSAAGSVLKIDASAARPDGGPIFAPETPAPLLFGPRDIAANAVLRRPSRMPGNGNYDSEVKPADDDPWVIASTQGRDVQGVSPQSLLVRLALAARFFESGFLRNRPQPGDVVLWHRSAASRCRQLAPFLDWPEDEARPVLISQGAAAGHTTPHLMWLVPGLVWSDDYPDSATPAVPGTSPPGVNYGRQAAVGVVDARSGQVSLFALSDDEPFVALYRRAFPGLIAPPTALSNEIRAQLRPSTSLLKAQALVWARYHETEPLDWQARKNDWRPLITPQENSDSTLRTLASQPMGDWTVMAYALLTGQAGAPGSPSPLVGILGADERDFATLGRVRFVDWRPRHSVAMPDIVAEPRTELLKETGRIIDPPPTLIAIAPSFDGAGAARGILATRGIVRLRTDSSSRSNPVPPGLKLTVLAASIGISQAPSPEPETSARAQKTNSPAQVLKEVQAAWKALRAARRQGNWGGAARAEKRLNSALQRS